MPGSHTQALGGGSPPGPPPHPGPPGEAPRVPSCRLLGSLWDFLEKPCCPSWAVAAPLILVLTSRELWWVPAPCLGSQPRVWAVQAGAEAAGCCAVLLCCSLVTQLCPILL